MTVSRTLLYVLAFLLVACANHQGLYEPGCAAYEGDILKLTGSRFEWQRFTDERIVNDSGEVVPPFPGFPKSGTYRVTEDKLQLVTDDNVQLEDWLIVDHAGHRYLLDANQHNAFVDNGDLPECALRFTPVAKR